jgi:signal transduction histidine kinase
MLKEDNGYILLTISDKGIGIPENELNNLFQPFFRATNAFSYKGSGIGLSLADKIIKLHGGNIVFSTTTGKGTKVEIRFTALTNISKSHSA